MARVPDAPSSASESKTWLIVGASRGIGHEFVRQLLKRGDRVLATTRQGGAKANQIWSEARDDGNCRMFSCDVSSEKSIKTFVADVVTIPDLKIDYVVLNAGVLRYPNRATELSFDDFSFHLNTNTIGPIITAQKLLGANISIGTIVFMSSDSGSTANFREMEDGFAAYAASKAALNQMLRHMAAELKRKESKTVILAMHPGEVSTDMASVDLPWEVEGMISPEESISAMLDVIPGKGIENSGTFWTWENKQYPW